MLYGSWDIEHNGQNFLWFLTIFAFLPPYNRDKKLFEKIKNQMPGDIILHMCTINENHMMNGSWDMKRDRPNVSSFWFIFYTFSPLPTQKIKILKNRKKSLRRHFMRNHQNFRDGEKANVPFPQPLKMSENQRLQGIWKWNTRVKCVKN